MRVEVVKRLRKNASQKSIDLAIEKIKEKWHQDCQNSPVLFFEGDYPIKEFPPIYGLQIGSQVRWGYYNGHWAWGFDHRHVAREIAGQIE